MSDKIKSSEYVQGDVVYLDKDTVDYGGVKLRVIHSKDQLVPLEAEPVLLKNSERRAIGTALEQNMPVLLIGETGTGKTSIVRHLAYITKRPYVRIGMTGFTTPDELIGSKSVKDGETYYEDGIIVDGMRRGSLLVLDEVNATSPDCMFIVHQLLDDDRRITLPNGEVIRPHPEFRVMATMNPEYEGTRGLNKAFLDRFGVSLVIDVLPPDKETELITERASVKAEVAQTLVTIGTMLRKAYAESKIGTFVSTRALIGIAKLSKAMPLQQAFSVGLVNRSSSTDMTVIKDTYSAVMKVAADSGGKDGFIVIAKSEIEKKVRDREEAIEARDKLMKEIASLKEQLKSSKEQEIQTIKEFQEKLSAFKAEQEENLNKWRAVDSENKKYQERISALSYIEEMIIGVAAKKGE